MATCLALLSFVEGMKPAKGKDPVEFDHVSIHYEAIQGIAPEAGMLRRDPSDVIQVGDLYYVWYTKGYEKSPGYPEGYNGTIWYATSKDGVQWAEQGEALGRGASGKFDAFGVFTPNILYAPTTGKYYLYYTGVHIEGGKTWDFKKFSGSIGVVVADTPDGGAKGWQRANKGDPILLPRTDKKGIFDGWHVDDSVMFYRDQKYWLYYKGHSLGSQLEGTGLPERSTPMGVAVSDRPEGGFQRVALSQKQSFLIQPGHELLLWPHGEGILSLPTGHYRPKHPDDFCLHYSSDGLLFSVVSPVISAAKLRSKKVKKGLLAPGVYRPDLTGAEEQHSGPLREPLWGIAMTAYGRNAGLQRFVLNLSTKVTANAH